MARLSTYIKDVNLTGKDMLAGSNYVTTVNGIDQFETNNFTLKKLSEYFIEQISIDPGNLPLKSNGGLVYETTLDTDYLAIDLSATNITGQLANSDLVNSYITINGSNIELGGSIDIPIGDITSVVAGTYLNGGGTINDITINHDSTSRSDTTSSPSQLAYDGTFTAITSVSTNATGHLTAINTATYTLPASDNTDNYVDSIAVTGTTTKTITLGRTGALSDLTATFDDNDTIPNDATITLSAGTYISGGGDFTTDQSANETIAFNHDSTTRTDTTSSVQPNHSEDFTVIDTLTSNATGHITAVNIKTVTLPDAVVPNDGLLDINEGTDISLTITGGDFSADKDTETDIIVNHANITRSPDTTSSVGPNHGGTFTTIDSITSSATGHITVANLKTVTLPNGANDNTITLSAGTYLSGGGNFTVDQSFDETLTINHDSTTRSDTTSTDNNNSHEDTFTVVDSISTNATGHVTGVNVKTVSFPADTNQDIDVNVSNLETRLGQIGNTSIGSSGSTITIPNLTVTGTQTINNVEVISTSSGIVFEGTSNDANETTLNVINPTADRAINLPNKSGTVALTDDIETYDLSVSSSGTAASIDLDLVNSGGTDIVVVTGGGGVDVTLNSAQQFTISHTDTSSQSSVNNSGNTFIQDITVDTYGHITGITSGTATDNDTITQIREDNSSYRTGNITLQSGTNVNITEPSTGVFRFDSTDTDTNNYVTSASVSGTTTKTLTLTRQGLSNLTATWTDLDTNTDTNYYLNTASFNTGNGVLSLGVTGYGTVTVDLDGRYLTSYSETDTLATVTARGNTTSATISVNQVIATNNGNGTNYRIGDDVWIGDVNLANTFRVQGVQDSTKGYITFGSSSNAALGRAGTGALTWDSNTIWHSGNDGAGTGLDADLLDGLHASSFLQSESDTLGTVTSRGNTTGLLKVETGSIGESNAGTAGLIINGNYTNGQYSHRWRKQDPGGNVPLYLDQSGATANSYTWQARFGAYSGNSITFEVNGAMKANGDIHCNRLYDVNTTYYFDGNDTGDSIRVAGDIIAYYSSDKRYKDNIINISNPLDKINKIGGYTFEWNKISHKETGKKDIGVIAQEIEEIFPEIVQTRENGYKAVDYPKLTALLIEAVKELSYKVKALENG